MNLMDTWLVFITARTLRGQAADAGTARALQDELALRTGRTGQPGVDPEVTITSTGAIRIRQSFPGVNTFQAVQLAREALHRPMPPEEVDAIETVRLTDWLTTA